MTAIHPSTLVNGMGLRRADLETITSHGIFPPARPAGPKASKGGRPPQEGREETWDKSQAWLHHDTLFQAATELFPGFICVYVCVCVLFVYINAQMY